MVLEKNAKEILNELRQLNLMDRFLFAEATEDPEVVGISRAEADFTTA